MSPTRYHPLLVTLHWLLAFTILLALGMGTFVLTEIPNTSPEKIGGLSDHMIAGIVILTLMLVRLGVRLFTDKPRPASTGSPLLDKVGRLTHYAFYLVVFLMAFSGIGTALQAGLPDIVFFGSGAPLPESFEIYPPRIGHGILAKVLMALIALHVSAALFHQFVRRDGLIKRMWFGKRHVQE